MATIFLARAIWRTSPSAPRVCSARKWRTRSKYGIVFLKPDGTLSKLVEKPDLAGPLLANTGAYLLPRHVFDIPLNLSPRGEYEITDYITELASRQPFHVVRARFWMPIGTEAAWRQAEQADLSPLSTIG